MNIQEAREKTGKARRPHWEHKKFVYLVGDDFHVDTGDGQSGFVYSDKAILGDDWQPYYEVKEIRPEKAGELWQAGNDSFFFTVNSDKIAGDNGDTYEIKDYEMIHGKHGWIRLYPPVEDDSVERIEFNNVDWDLSGCWQTKPMPFVSYDGGSKDWGDIRDAVINQPKMKMILEIPKDKP